MQPNHELFKEAQVAYLTALESLDGDLTEREREVLFQQRPITIDSEARLTLTYPTEEASRNARDLPALRRLARELRRLQLASDLAFRVDPHETKGAITAEAHADAKRRATRLLYLPAFLACATLPHSRPTGSEFTRQNGNSRLTFLAPAGTGLPYGVYPRLILMQFATGAVRTRQKHFLVDSSLRSLLSHVQISLSGGPRGGYTQVLYPTLFRLTNPRLFLQE